MSANIWFTSDPHFQHENILKFVDGKGKHVREGFASAQEMDETIIHHWNECVKDGDKIYCLGDVIFGDRKNLKPIMNRLNGAKRLLIGNHDDVKDIVRSEVFQKVGLWRIFKEHNFTCTHIPLPEDQFRFKVKLNVHGHIHADDAPSPHHMNICVERTDYRPIALEEITAEIKRRGL